ncbi:MAG TPA: hypothetical protein VIH52_03840 [Candidatus Nanoarchaeia archaeon]
MLSKPEKSKIPALMGKSRIYIKHQAFNAAYEAIEGNSEARVDGFDAPKKYHHDPSKLDKFRDFSKYLVWASELYSASSKLTSQLRTLYDEARYASSSFYVLNSEGTLKIILVKLDGFQLDLKDLHDDIAEFQACMLATHISEKQAEIEALSDELMYLSSLENRLADICNRKLYEISSSRMGFYSLFVSVIALSIALFS